MIREHPFDRYSLIRLAEEQYDPSLVMIDSHRISSIPWPADSSSPMTLQLAESVAANEKSAVSFLLAITSINYRFWYRAADGTLGRYSHLGKTGARALWAAFEAAWGPTIHTGSELAKRLHADEFAVLFGNMPDRDGRLAILGEILTHDKLSAATELLLADIHAHRQVTVAQAAGLAAIFPLAFDDPYLKKAQLALSMIGAFLRTTGLNGVVSENGKNRTLSLS